MQVKVKVKLLSCVQLFGTPWTVAYQAFPSMGFSRQEYWSGLPFPSPGDLSNPGIKPMSPALQADAFTLWATRESMQMTPVQFLGWRRERLPTPVFWPGEFHGLYSPWGCKELDMTEQLSPSTWRQVPLPTPGPPSCTQGLPTWPSYIVFLLPFSQFVSCQSPTHPLDGSSNVVSSGKLYLTPTY